MPNTTPQNLNETRKAQILGPEPQDPERARKPWTRGNLWVPPGAPLRHPHLRFGEEVRFLKGPKWSISKTVEGTIPFV